MLAHYTKGTISLLQALSDIRHPISLENLTPPKDFSPFPHGTCALSVSSVFLGLEDGSPIFKQGFTCLVLLENNRNRKLEDFHLPWLTKFHCYCLLTYIDYLWPKSGFARHYYQNLG